MNSFFEKYGKLLKRIGFLFLLALTLYIVITILLPFFWPFAVATVIVLINEPIVKFLESKLRMKRKIASAVSLLFTVSLIGIILFLAVNRLYKEAVDLAKSISEYVNKPDSKLYLFFSQIQSFYQNLGPEAHNTLQGNLNKLAESLPGMANSLLAFSRDTIQATINSVPKVIISIIITLISSYFLSSDKDKVLAFIHNQLPAELSKRFNHVRVDILTAFAGYLRALLILMSITFLVLAIGLSIIGVRYSVVLALFIALVDALPILGTGTILIPWMVWNVITGNIQLAVSLLILYCTVILIRQLFEPKIVGSQIGLHPLITLLAIYVGLNLFGFLGMILGPITVLVLKNMQRAGIIHIWNE